MPPYIKQGFEGGFLIFSEEWHDGLPCPTKEGTLGGSPTVNLYVLIYVVLTFPLTLGSYRTALLLF